MNEDDLAGYLGDVKISSIVFPLDRQTRRPKGFAYVEFFDRASLVAALERDGETINQRPILVDVASERKRSGAGQRNSGSGFFDRPRGERREDRYGGREERRYGNDDRHRFGGRYQEGRHTGLEAGPGAADDVEKRDAPLERPRLSLLPRSKSIEEAEVEKDAAANKPQRRVSTSNPFGDAKPRDESKTKYLERKKSESSGSSLEAQKRTPKKDKHQDQDDGSNKEENAIKRRHHHYSSEGMDDGSYGSNRQHANTGVRRGQRSDRGENIDSAAGEDKANVHPRGAHAHNVHGGRGVSQKSGRGGRESNFNDADKDKGGRSGASQVVPSRADAEQSSARSRGTKNVKPGVEKKQDRLQHAPHPVKEKSSTTSLKPKASMIAPVSTKMTNKFAMLDVEDSEEHSD
jgi:RNA recognition motif-containing protein